MSSDARAPIRRAILSVTDKTGLVDFAQKLAGMGVELISTGGTAKMLRDSGISVKDISELTGFTGMLDGTVKPLHPKVHGGILHRRENPSHRTAVAEHGIQPIDMVVVNLYAFEKTAAKPGVHFEELIENIDIGGPSMIRSAAKNFQDVAVVTSPEDYGRIAEEMAKSGAALSSTTKWCLAQKAFATTAAYDSAIASTLERVSANGRFEFHSESGFPNTLRLSFNKIADLRYGENPHQKAAMYSDGSGAGVANGRQLQGKELSYNNIVDLQAAWDLAQEFEEPVCAIIKHTNPSGEILVQDADLRSLQEGDLKIVTKRPPTAEEKRALLFAWKVCKHVKSNAILYARDGQTVGVGAGQMSRVDSCRIGAMKAVLPLKGTVAASDAFFPFPDGVEEIAKAGATAIIQPGGSVRDQEVIEAANRFGLAMIFTGVRHFRH